MYYGQLPGVLSWIINHMYEIIYLQLESLLDWDHHWLTVDKLKEYAQTIFENGGEQVQVAEGIFGFIDGTVRKIARPTFNQEIFYSGWKRCHAIKFQGIMAPDGILMHVSGPYTAKHHDMWMLRRSRIQETLDQHIGLEHGLRLYGDAGYHGQEPWVKSAARNPNSDADVARMNYRMSTRRITVEWGYGRVSK